MKRIIWTIVLTLVVVLLIPVIVLVSGMINMAASQEPGALEKTLASFAVKRSVAVRASEKSNPFLDDEKAVSSGLRHYAAMCAQCHGGPGVEPEEFARGLNPQPPDLEQAAKEYLQSELYWIIKHGIRMTGMPAFGATHDTNELWKIAAFVQKLPELTDEQKEQLKRAAAKAQAHGSDSSHDHAEAGHDAEGHPGHHNPNP